MDCRTARLLCELRGDRPGELPPEDTAALQRHLEACPECQNRQAVETKFDIAIAKAMRAVPVPPNLKSRILDQLATQRGAWYRKRFFYVAAAAACVIAAVGVLTWSPNRAVQFNQNEFAVETGGRLNASTGGRAEKWLESVGIAYHAPADFDPRLLTFHGHLTVQGKQVPALEYQSFDPLTSSPVIATLYVVKDGDFDLKTLPESFGGSLANGLQAKIFRDRDQPDKVAYVVIFSGRGLEPFLMKYSST